MKRFKTIEPLSNFRIIDECRKLKIENFKDCLMRDELQNISPSKNQCMIINIDCNPNVGTHWTSLFIRDGLCFYFDPFGVKPTLEVEDYCKQFHERYYSSYPIQNINEVICGHYCIYVIYKLNNKVDFEDILNELYNLKK